MKRIFQCSFAIMASTIILSCGTGKKLKSALADNEKLTADVAQLTSKATDYEKQLAQLKTENVAYSKEAADCRMVKEALAKKNESFKQALAAEGTSMEQIEKKFETGLGKFENAGADVEYKDGLLHVTLADKLLFAKGSSKIGADGIEALKVVAEVLNDNPKTQLYVVGNTDTTHVKGVADNWSLSTERANTVVRILRDTYKVDPARLIAAGRGKYNPVADNSTEEGKAKNRRIDLIINANVSKLWDLYLQQ